MASPRSKRFVCVLVFLVLVGGLVAWQWYPIRVKMVLWSTAPVEEKTEALRALGTPAIPAMIGAYESTGGSWEDKALIGSLLVREPYRRVVVLERGLASDSKTLRRASAAMLVGTRNLDDRARILACLEEWAADPDFGYRVDLANAAKELRSPEAVTILATILADRERARRARINAADYLGVYYRDDEAIIAPLVSAAREDPSELVRARALQSLGSAGWAEDMSVYAELIDAEDSRARQMLAIGLGALKTGEPEELLGRILEDPVAVVRRSALRSLISRKSRIIAENAELLREDSYMGVRGDLSTGLGELGDDSLVPVVVPGLLDREPDDQFNIVVKTAWALHVLTRKHHGFPDEPFRSSRMDPLVMQKVAREWSERPLTERLEVVKKWGEEYGSYDRRPALLQQLRHADPANVARAVRELRALTAESGTPGAATPTPGFATPVVEAADGVFDPDAAAFESLVEAAREFQALPVETRSKLLSEWVTLYGS